MNRLLNSTTPETVLKRCKDQLWQNFRINYSKGHHKYLQNVAGSKKDNFDMKNGILDSKPFKKMMQN